MEIVAERSAFVRDNNRLHQMDGLRGVAMLFVFMGHFAGIWSGVVPPNGTAGLFLRLVDADATFGSSFFMLVSAFFTYGSMMRGRRNFGEFLRGRLVRLYPLYLIMTMVYIVGSIAIPSMSKLPPNPHDALVFIIETLLFLPGLLPIRPLMDVSWTLSFIVLFYFVEAGITRLFQRYGFAWRTRFFLLLGMAIVWAVAGDLLHCWEPRTAALWVGMALWELVARMSAPDERLRSAVRLAWPSFGFVLAGVALRTLLMLSHPHTALVSILLWSTAVTSVTLSGLVWTAYFGPNWWKILLSGSLLRRLGAASYSFYLTHGLGVKIFHYGIIPWLRTVAGTPVVFWTSQIVGLGISVATALIVHRLVENPLSQVVTNAISGTIRSGEVKVAFANQRA
jgi:exopolysaccharide production protein ExoZ